MQGPLSGQFKLQVTLRVCLYKKKNRPLFYPQQIRYKIMSHSDKKIIGGQGLILLCSYL